MSQSEEETLTFGRKLGKELPLDTILCCFGDLGVGKTTLVKGIVAGATGLPIAEVNSPTFVYLNIHQGTKTVYHFDLYRLSDGDEFLSMGFDDYFFAGGVCCLEWSERIASLLPKHAVHVYMEHAGQNCRAITLLPSGER